MSGCPSAQTSVNFASLARKGLVSAAQTSSDLWKLLHGFCGGLNGAIYGVHAELRGREKNDGVLRPRRQHRHGASVPILCRLCSRPITTGRAKWRRCSVFVIHSYGGCAARPHILDVTRTSCPDTLFFPDFLGQMTSSIASINFRLPCPEIPFREDEDSTNPIICICRFLVEPGLRGLDFGDLQTALGICCACLPPRGSCATSSHGAHSAGEPRTSILLPWTHGR